MNFRREGYEVVTERKQKKGATSHLDIYEAATAGFVKLSAFSLTLKGAVLGGEKHVALEPVWWLLRWPTSVTDFYFIVNGDSGLVVDIKNSSSTPGTPLDAYTQKKTYPDYNNQIWSFVKTADTPEGLTFIAPPKWTET